MKPLIKQQILWFKTFVVFSLLLMGVVGVGSGIEMANSYPHGDTWEPIILVLLGAILIAIAIHRSYTSY
jgi:hypothetical protein